MGQATNRPASECIDLLITNALIVDWSGIYKADIGVKNGLICGIGKAGNPDVMAGVHANLLVGSATEVIAGEKLIVTAGAIDAHIHFICPQQCEEVRYLLFTDNNQGAYVCRRSHLVALPSSVEALVHLLGRQLLHAPHRRSTCNI
jgi:hypothetical protein